jgi:uncharacterized coiled-coil protein SlyX
MPARRNPTRRTARVGQLLERVIQQRRSASASAATEAPAGEPDQERRIGALEQRVEYLESLLEGLQDSVHREAARHEREMKALEAKTQAPEMARAIDKYSRERGV